MKRKITTKGIIICLVFSFFIFSLARQWMVINQINENIIDKTKELETLKDKNVKLQEELTKAQEGNIEYLEKLARERLGLIIDGEQIVKPSEPQE